MENLPLTYAQVIQCKKETFEEVKRNDNVWNYFVNFENGDSLMLHCNQPNIGERSVKQFAEKVTGNKVIEVYHVPQNELQYYCIDERVWVDTPAKAQKLLSYVN